jgi:hypothetical protein
MATGTINLTTGKILGSIKLDSPFEFILGSAATQNIEITGEDDDGNPYEWFSSDPATITKGSTSVTVTATASSSEEEPYFTYGLTGMVGAENVHVVVSASEDIEKAG